PEIRAVGATGSGRRKSQRVPWDFGSVFRLTVVPVEPEARHGPPGGLDKYILFAGHLESHSFQNCDGRLVVLENERLDPFHIKKLRAAGNEAARSFLHETFSAGLFAEPIAEACDARRFF